MDRVKISLTGMQAVHLLDTLNTYDVLDALPGTSDTAAIRQREGPHWWSSG